MIPLFCRKVTGTLAVVHNDFVSVRCLAGWKTGGARREVEGKQKNIFDPEPGCDD